MKSAKNIIAIERVGVSSLKDFRRLNLSSVQLSDSIAWRPLDIRVPARLTITDKIEDGVRVYTAQLVFRTCEEIVELDRYAYLCHTADGRLILFGNPERPYPVAMVTRNRPDNMADSQLDEFSVNWSTVYPIPYVGKS